MFHVLGLNMRGLATHIPQSATHLGRIPHKASLNLGIKKQNPFIQVPKQSNWDFDFL